MLGIKSKNYTQAGCSIIYGLKRDKPMPGRAPHKYEDTKVYNVCGREVIQTYKYKGETKTTRTFCDRVHTLKDPDGITPRAILLYNSGEVFASLYPLDYWRIAEGKEVKLDAHTTICVDIPEIVQAREEKERARQLRIEKARARVLREKAALEKAKEKARKEKEKARLANEKARKAREQAKAKQAKMDEKARTLRAKKQAKAERERLTKQQKAVRKIAKKQAREKLVELDLFATLIPPVTNECPAKVVAPTKKTAPEKAIKVKAVRTKKTAPAKVSTTAKDGHRTGADIYNDYTNLDVINTYARLLQRSRI